MYVVTELPYLSWFLPLWPLSNTHKSMHYFARRRSSEIAFQWPNLKFGCFMIRSQQVASGLCSRENSNDMIKWLTAMIEWLIAMNERLTVMLEYCMRFETPRKGE